MPEQQGQADEGYTVLQETIEKTDAQGKLLPEMVSTIAKHFCLHFLLVCSRDPVAVARAVLEPSAPTTSSSQADCCSLLALS